MGIVVNELIETAHRFTEHMWLQSTFIVLNNNGLCGQDSNDSSLFNAGGTIDHQLVEFWCTWNNEYGYGIFHSWRYSEQDGFVVVSTCYMSWIPMFHISF